MSVIATVASSPSRCGHYGVCFSCNAGTFQKMLLIGLALSFGCLLSKRAMAAEPAPRAILDGPIIPCLSISRDGSKIAVGGASDDGAQLLIYDAGSLKLVRTISPEGTSAKAVTFSADGRLLFAAVGREVVVYELPSGKLVSSLTHHTDFVYAISASSDGNYLASGGQDGRVCLWDAKTLKRSVELSRHSKSVHDLVFHPLGQQLAAVGAGGYFRLWKRLDSDLAQDIPCDQVDSLISVRFSPKGDMIAATTQLGDVLIADSAQPQKLPRQFRLGPNLSAATWLENEQNLVFGINRESVLFNVREGAVAARFHKFDSLIRCVSFSPNTHTVAVAAGNGTIKVWNSDDLTAE